MSLNLYLDSEKVRLHPTYRPRVHNRGLFEVLGAELHFNEAGPHIFTSMDTVLLPEAAEMLVRATLHVQYKAEGSGPRQRGLYRSGMADGTLEMTRIDGIWNYFFQGSAPTVEGVRDLYMKIRAGSISPVESWETEQVPPPVISSLRRFFRRLWREITATS